MPNPQETNTEQNLNNQSDFFSSQEPLDTSFFNVMPKNINKIPVPEKKAAAQKSEEVKIQTSNLEPKSLNTSGSTFGKYKFYFVALIVFIILGPTVYFGVQKIGSTRFKTNNILTNDETTTPKNPIENANKNQSVISGEWLLRYFGAAECLDESLCGNSADPDRDGLTNQEEYLTGTDPNNADSDGDGLSDGDEIKVLNTNPLKSHTINNSKFSDAEYFLGSYSLTNDKLMSKDELENLSKKMQEQSLHQPTIKTLFDVLESTYHFSPPSASSTPLSSLNRSSVNSSSTATGTDLNLENTIAAKQDRDTQRSLTIKNLGIALTKFYDDNKTFPKVSNIQDAYSAVRPYLKVAANAIDPINKDPYVYTYSTNDLGNDFTLTFFSETAGAMIKKHSTDARKDRSQEEAGIYDDQRKNDLESIRTALLVYSSKNIAGNQAYVFPTTAKYKTELVPNYLSSIPKDPKTQTDYAYSVSETFDSFTIKAILDAPVTGTTGYICNQEECRNY